MINIKYLIAKFETILILDRIIIFQRQYLKSFNCVQTND